MLNVKHKGGSSREKKNKWGGGQGTGMSRSVAPWCWQWEGGGGGGAAGPTLCSLTHAGVGWCRMGAGVAGPLRHFPGSARSLCDSVTTCCWGGGRKWGSAPWWGQPPPPPGRALQPPILTCPSRVSMVLMSTILRTGLSAGCGSSTGAQRRHQPPLCVPPGVRGPPRAGPQGPTCTPVGSVPQKREKRPPDRMGDPQPPPHLSFSC